MSNQVTRTIREINEKIKKGKAVVLNAREMASLVRRKGKVKAAGEVDVVTTGTFSPMCSSGLLFNIGQTPPTIKASRVWLNNVPAYGGLAAVDAYLGATEPVEDDPLNKVYPGKFKYGGAHVIEDLVRGRSVHLLATGYGTDCYPRTKLEKKITLQEMRNAILLNPRNGYQNYNCAVNVTSKTIHTYMGPLKSNLGNANYATSGELSPLFNDPYFRTIGVGTRVFLGGGTGYVTGAGTQHNPKPQRNERGLPVQPAGTLMVQGDLKGMDGYFLRGVSMLGYGVSLAVGLGIPIPILDEEMAWFTGVGDEDIQMPVVDYGHDYPNGIGNVLKLATFDELQSGRIDINGRSVPTVPVTSYKISLEVADRLKQWIQKGEFLLTEPQAPIPSA
ncbi:MAG: homocysteine biosynthesis protein [Desulfovibrionales bacterium]